LLLTSIRSIGVAAGDRAAARLVEDGHVAGLQRRRALDDLHIAGEDCLALRILDLQLVALDLDRLVVRKLKALHATGGCLREGGGSNQRSAEPGHGQSG
jgi:hypothetical protein